MVAESLLLIVVTLAHILAAPFTKVEESFNLQAVHDICKHGLNISAYDHVEFSGVVPRTFLGALAVSAPGCTIINGISLLGASNLSGLYVTRIILAFFTLAGIFRLRQAVAKSLGHDVGRYFILILCVQFHPLFYAGRPLPNSFAAPLVSWAVALWLEQRFRSVVGILAFTSLVIRCDLIPFAGLVGIAMLIQPHGLRIKDAVVYGVLTSSVSVGLSVLVDSFFWQRWLWPEGNVLWFNTAENRSSEWGVQPWHWYFTSALPRGLLLAYPLLCVGFVMERRIRILTLVTLAYIAAYSILPHKELRFLLPVMAVLNIPAACGTAFILRGQKKNLFRRSLSVGFWGMLITSSAVTFLLLAVSHLNYPGGHAMSTVHKLEPCNDGQGHKRISLHIDVLPAMTGVSRFGQECSSWQYSKMEGLELDQLRLENFTYLLSAHQQVPGFELLRSIRGFSGLSIQWRPRQLLDCLRHFQLPLRILQQHLVYIHNRTNLELV